MIILFGVKKKNFTYNAYASRYCEKCGRDTKHYLFLQKRAFSIFFIPLIPLGTKKYMVCAECKNVVPVKEFPRKEDIEVVKTPERKN